MSQSTGFLNVLNLQFQVGGRSGLFWYIEKKADSDL